jgi:hypothetical protein
MAAAALAVAILALLVSGWAAWTAHRAFALERARRHDERAPRIEAEEGDHAAVEGIRLTNRGPVDLSSLQFSIVGDADRRGPVDALLVARGDWRAAGDLGPLTMGQSRFVPLRYSREAHTTTLRLLLVCTSGKNRWEFPVEVDITLPSTGTMGT